MGDKEKILVNPDFNLPSKPKRGIAMVKSSDIQLNPENAKYERIRTYIHQRNQNITIVFKWNELYKQYEIGLAWQGGFIYALPPDKEEEEKEFADTLYETWVETQKIPEEDLKLRLKLTNGRLT